MSPKKNAETKKSKINRTDFKQIKKWVKRGETVLDLGCENGDLLKLLQRKKNAKTLGIEINTSKVNNCITKGIEVIQANLDDGLEMFDDNSFDMVIMTETIQALNNPIAVLKEMIRVGKRCIITFPNFAYISLRAYLVFKGKMPITKHLTFQWHDTPNIHFCTIKDFEATCHKNEIQILSNQFIGIANKTLLDAFPNLFARTALYQLKTQN